MCNSCESRNKVTDRFLEPRDLSNLALSLANDKYHETTSPEFFLQPGTVTKVYEDDDGPICFVRGAKALRLDIQFMSNSNTRRNIKVMLESFEALAEKARNNGFTEVIFNTDNDLLRRFCAKRFGFVDSAGELRKFL